MSGHVQGQKPVYSQQVTHKHGTAFLGRAQHEQCLSHCVMTYSGGHWLAFLGGRVAEEGLQHLILDGRTRCTIMDSGWLFVS